MPPSTWICLGAIVVAFIFCLVLVIRFKKNDKLISNRRIVEYFPTAISTLGVLGTFGELLRDFLISIHTTLVRLYPIFLTD